MLKIFAPALKFEHHRSCYILCNTLATHASVEVTFTVQHQGLLCMTQVLLSSCRHLFSDWKSMPLGMSLFIAVTTEYTMRQAAVQVEGSSCSHPEMATSLCYSAGPNQGLPMLT